jgi:DNA-binding SARP family transcriptional activator
MDRVLRLFTLGRFEALVGNEPMDLSRRGSRRIAKELLALIIAAHPARLSRDVAADQLSPGADDDTAHGRLHQALHSLRRLLEPELAARASSRFVLSDRDTIYFAGGEHVEVDSEDFFRLSEANQSDDNKERGLALYRGEFLPEMDLPTKFLALREKLHRQFRACALALHESLLTQRQNERAVKALSHVMSVDPTNEDACYALMQSYIAENRRDDARRCFDRLAQALSDEVGVAPNAALRDLALSLKTGLAQSARSAVPASAPPASLGHAFAVPAPLKRLVNRPHWVRRVADELLVRRYRLVTLLGLGGMGKTTLAMQCARDIQDRFSLGSCLVSLPLSPLTREELALHIAAAISVGGSQGEVESAIVNRLRAGSCLLVIDNYLAGTNSNLLIAHLLQQCPDLTLLVTARAACGLESERIIHLHPMSLPETGAAARPVDSESVALFVLRAEDYVDGFELDSASQQAVSEICAFAQGYPLTIEIIASRLRHSPAQQILDSVRSFERGSTSEQNAISSIQSILRWAWENASADAQRTMAWASVFHIPFGARILEHAATFTQQQLAANLHELHQLGLLQRANRISATIGASSYTMLDVVREFAQRMLNETGEKEAAFDWYSETLLKRGRSLVRNHLLVVPTWGWSEQGVSFADLTAATEWTIANGRHTSAVEHFACLCLGLFERSRFVDFEHFRNRFSVLWYAELDTRHRAQHRFSIGLGRAMGFLDRDSVATLKEAAVGFAAVGDRAGELLAKRYAAAMLSASGQRVEGLQLAKEIDEGCAELDDDNLILKIATGVTFVFLECGQAKGAHAAAKRAVTLTNAPGVSDAQRLSALLSACHVFMFSGELETASRYADELHALAWRAQHERHQYIAAQMLAEISITKNDLDTAEKHIVDLIVTTKRRGETTNELAQNNRLSLALAVARGACDDALLVETKTILGKLRTAERTGHWGWVGNCSAYAAALWFVGRQDEAVETLLDASQAVEQTPFGDQLMFAGVVAEVGRALGLNAVIDPVGRALRAVEAEDCATTVCSDVVFLRAIQKTPAKTRLKSPPKRPVDHEGRTLQAHAVSAIFDIATAFKKP